MPALPLLRLLLVVALTTFTSLALPAENKPRLVWMIRDLPPFNILEGPLKNQGIADHMLRLLQARLPQYQHVVAVANQARSKQMLGSGALICDTGLLKSPEREEILYFSIATMGLQTNGVMIRKQQEQELAPFIDNGQFDLPAFIAADRYTLGTLVGRSYGPVIDAELAKLKADKRVVHYGIEASRSLLRMQQHDRLTAVLGYGPELRYSGELEQMDLEQLSFYPIKGAPPYLMGYVGCSKTPEGLEAIQRINKAVRELRQGEIVQLYANWLDKRSRAAYLQAAKGFFTD